MTLSVSSPTQKQKATETKRLRIAYLFQQAGLHLDDESGSGPLVHVKAIVQNLQQAGHRVTFLALKSARKVLYSETLTDEREAHLGFTDNPLFKSFESVVRRGQKLLHLPYFALFDSLRFYDACLHTLPGFDVIHERFTKLSIGGVLAARKLGIPVVLEVNADILDEWDSFGQGLRGLQRLVVRWNAAFCFRHATTIVAVSSPLKTQLVKAWNLPIEKIVVLPNGADVEHFQPHPDPRAVRRRLGVEDVPSVVFVSGFYPWHASLELVDSFVQVHQQIPTAHLYMIGDGQMRNQTETYARQLGLEQVISFVGAVRHEKIPDWLAIADVAVMPYPKMDRELWFSPLKMYEYMAAGKAIVASRAGQIAEVISDGDTGLLIEPGDTEHFAQALILLLANEGERNRLGTNARQQAVARHSWQQYAHQLETIYLDALAHVKHSL